ncbi:MAG: glycoside hydrolase family 38 N-terminal domain-containing protein [Armatimonadota bacterium]
MNFNIRLICITSVLAVVSSVFSTAVIADQISPSANISLSGFEKAVPSMRWGNGRIALSPDTAEKKEGRQSLRCEYSIPDNGHAGFNVTFDGAYAFRKDGSLSVWIHNDTPKPNYSLLVDLSTDNTFGNAKYFRASRALDWEGWKLISFTRKDFSGAPDSYWSHIASARFILQHTGGPVSNGIILFDDFRAQNASPGDPMIPDGWLWDEPTEAAPVKMDSVTAQSIMNKLDIQPIDDPAAIAISQAKGLFPVSNALADVGFSGMSEAARTLGLWYLQVGESKSLDKILFPFRKKSDFPVRYKTAKSIDWEKVNDAAVKTVEKYAVPPKDKKIVNVYMVSRSHEDIGSYGWGGPGDYNQKLKLVLDTMDKDPEFYWTCEQACLIYAYWIAYPKDHAHVTKYVRSGRLEVMAPWHLFYGTQEHGEALIRSINQAQEWMRKTFGVNADTLCRSDSSAQPDQLPQISAKSGIKNLFLQFHSAVDEDFINNPIVGPDTRSEFIWETPDGSRTTVHRMLRWYLGIGRDMTDKMSKEERFKLIDKWIKWLEPIAQTDNIHVPVSDDFGVPRPILTQIIHEWNTEVFPKTGYQLIPGTASMYFAAVNKELREKNRSLKVVHGGDFGSPWWIGGFMESPIAKEIMRRAETKLTDAETFATVASTLGMTYPREMLNRGWNLLERMYKHDGIEGSTSDYIRAGSVTGMSDFILDRSLKQIASKVDTSRAGKYPLMVFNPLGWSRSDIVEADFALPAGYKSVKVVDALTGANVLSEYKDGKVTFTAFDVPSVGYRLYNLVPMETDQQAISSLSVNGTEIENKFYKISLNPERGGTISILDKEYGKTVIDGALMIRDLIENRYVGGGQGIYSLGTKEVIIPTTPGKFEVIESGPKSVKVRLESVINTVKAQTEFTVYDDIRRIDVRTTLDLTGIPQNDGIHTYTIEFPFTEDGKWTHATPYGFMPRQTTDKDYIVNDYFLCRESSDCSNDQYGVSLLSKDLQTFRLFNKRMHTLALCRFDSTNRWVSQTHSTSSFAIYPHLGDWHSAQVYRRGIEFNHPMLTVMAEPHTGELPAKKAFVSVDGDNVTLTALKRGSEDPDAVVMRLLETKGVDAEAKVRFFRPFDRIAYTNSMEENMKPVAGGSSIDVKTKPKEFITLMGWMDK